jgi:NAD-reducing hydrogenase small subunit
VSATPDTGNREPGTGHRAPSSGHGPRPKLTLATTSLAGCFGCHMSFLDIDERILELVQLYDLRKSPLDDLKGFTEVCDVGLVEGGCCNTHNVHVLREFRTHCRLLVSVGQCAITGGLPAMRNGIPLAELFAESYQKGPTLDTALIPSDEDLPMILDRIYPCHEVVKVDAFLPGCPPSADLIWEALTAIAAGRPLDVSYRDFKFD